MKTKSDYILMGFLILLAVAFVGALLTSEDIDEVCATNQSYLYRDGTWQCGNVNVIYGELWGKNDSGFFNVNLTTVDTYVMVGNLTGGYRSGFTNNSMNLTAQSAGMYKLTAKFGVELISGAGGENGMKVFVNSSPQNNCYDHEHTSTSQPIGFIIDCTVNLSVGDNVGIGFDDHNSPVSDLRIINGNINLIRIGD